MKRLALVQRKKGYRPPMTGIRIAKDKTNMMAPCPSIENSRLMVHHTNVWSLL
jgi:hypothetical protein